MAVEISLQESALWRRRLQRLEAMLTQDPVSCDETTTRELFTAAIRGDVEEFIRVVERYCSEHNLRLCLHVVRSPSRNSLLHVAAGLNRDDILRAIVGHFPDQLVAGKNCRGDTALHVAARAGRGPAARVLIGRALDVGGGEMQRALVRVKNDRGNTPLHEAVWNGHRDVVQVLISEDLQPMYMKNKEGKCAVSLAVESGDVKVLGVLLAEPLDPSRIQGVSPVHAAVLHGKLDMLREISRRNPELFGLKDDRGGTPLHLAAYINYYDGIRFLLEKFASSAVEYDRDGHFPIHVACKQGHVQAIKELVQQWPDPMELINRHGQNILHVCTMHGRIQAMKYILRNANLEKLINENDNDGNTPLHLATLPWQPVALLHLLQDKRADLELVNNECLTALDFAVEQARTKDSWLQKRLPSIILKSAEAPTSKDLAMCKPRDKEILAEMAIHALQKGGALKNLVDIRLVVASLVATVTFTAGFSIPGGHKNGPGADAGMAQMLNRSMFHAFVICNTVAMYSAIGAVLVWPWTQFDDSYVALSAHVVATLALLVSLGTMSVAFMAGSYVLVSTLTWLASLVLLLGAGALFCICHMCIALYAPVLMNRRYLRSMAFYIIYIGITISKSVLHFPEVMEDEDSRPAGTKGTRTTVTSNLYRPGILPSAGGH
ncbi:hypothetical protein BT93_B1694 [Corymbia citriodora subsp. variegata]|nr:hypothetical protein BT93_B1694 [Corymbia citriodora subsp. variegata]